MNENLVHLDEDSIRKIPKAELHIHLRGAMTVEYFSQLAEKYSLNDIFDTAFNDRQKKMLWDTEKIKKYLLGESTADELFSFTNFSDFLKTYFFTGAFFKDVHDLKALANSVCDNLIDQGVCYVEFTVSLREYLDKGMDIDDIFIVLKSVSEHYKEKGLVVNYIIDLVRNYGPDKCDELLDLIVQKRFHALVGINLGGDEIQFPPEQFTSIYQKAKQSGLKTTIHSGEGLGASSVKYVIENISPDRIGHGIRSVESVDVMMLLRDRAIPIEVCISSNLALGLYETALDHPVKKLIDNGLLISLNTDDPGFFDCTIIDEIKYLQSLDVNQDKIVSIIRNGFLHSFADDECKQRLLSEFDAHVVTHNFV